MSNFLLYAKTRILAKHNIKNGNIFLYFEKKTQLVSAEIKNGKIAILPQTPSLSDLTGSRPAKINISEKDDSSSIQNMVYDGTTYDFTYEGKIYLNPDVMNSNAVVHSEEFISKFGDWEKVLRLKNLLKHQQSLSIILSKRFFYMFLP